MEEANLKLVIQSMTRPWCRDKPCGYYANQKILASNWYSRGTL